MKKYIGFCFLLATYYAIPANLNAAPLDESIKDSVVSALPSKEDDSYKTVCMRNQAYDTLRDQDQNIPEGAVWLAKATSDDIILDGHGGLSSFQNRFMSDVLPNCTQSPESFAKGTRTFLGESPLLQENPELLSQLSWGSAESSLEAFLRAQINSNTRSSYLDSWSVDGTPVTAKELKAGFILGTYSGIISLENANEYLQKSLKQSSSSEDASLDQVQSVFPKQHHDVFVQDKWKKRLSDNTQSKKVFFDTNERRFSIDPWPHEDALSRLSSACSHEGDVNHHTQPCAWKPNVARYLAKVKGIPPLVLFATSRPVKAGENLLTNSFLPKEAVVTMPPSLSRSDFLVATSFDEDARDEAYFGWLYEAPATLPGVAVGGNTATTEPGTVNPVPAAQPALT